MPLIRKQKLEPDTWLALWQMTEAVDQLPAPASVDLSPLHSPRRKKETLTEYLLLKALTGDDSLVIRHNEDELRWWKATLSASPIQRAGRR